MPEKRCSSPPAASLRMCYKRPEAGFYNLLKLARKPEEFMHDCEVSFNI
jgi:hypothetical protein